MVLFSVHLLDDGWDSHTKLQVAASMIVIFVFWLVVQTCVPARTGYQILYTADVRHCVNLLRCTSDSNTSMAAGLLRVRAPTSGDP